MYRVLYCFNQVLAIVPRSLNEDSYANSSTLSYVSLINEALIEEEAFALKAI